MALALIVSAWYAYAFSLETAVATAGFDGQRAWHDVKTQVDFGARVPGSEAHARTLDWMQAQLIDAGWHVTRQQAEAMGHPIVNLVARRTQAPPLIVVGAHYDSRLYADHDPDEVLRSQAVPGANDGASGVAVLLELARSLPPSSTPIMLVFFDGEDNGRIPGWDWILGSRAFVEKMDFTPQAMVLVDMVGDRDLRLRPEGNSDSRLRESIWATATRLGYAAQFPTEGRGAILDDHVPFIEAGIPSVNIIDLDYEFWHTSADTPDKVAPASLQAVGDVLLTWLSEQSNMPVP